MNQSQARIKKKKKTGLKGGKDTEDKAGSLNVDILSHLKDLNTQSEPCSAWLASRTRETHLTPLI